MTRSSSIYFSPPVIRAADTDREQSLRELRGHWMDGRLNLDDYEDRCAAATQARYMADLAAALRELPCPRVPAAPVAAPAPQRVEGVASLSLGITGLVLLLFSVGLLSLITLPLSVSAWALGRTARRRARGGGGSVAVSGEILGIIGTVLGCLALAACAVMVA